MQHIQNIVIRPVTSTTFVVVLTENCVKAQLRVVQANLTKVSLRESLGLLSYGRSGKHIETLRGILSHNLGMTWR